MLTALVAFTACSTDRDDNPVLTVPANGSFELYAPGIIANAIDLDNSSSITFKCNQPDYGYTAPVIYMMEFAASEDGTNWSSWQPTETTNEDCRAITIPTKEIAGAVTSGLLEIGRVEDDFPLNTLVKARVRAYLRGLEETTTVYSQEVQFDASTSYVLPPVELLKLYMVGVLTNWNKDGALTALFYPEEEEVYTYTTRFAAGNNLKIWKLDDLMQENWNGAFGSAIDNDNSTTGTIVNEEAGAIAAPADGLYTFSFDKRHMTYEWTLLDDQQPVEYQSMWVVGSFNGWPGDAGEEMTQVTPHNWYVQVKITEKAELKFRANNSWDVNWGFGSDRDWHVTADDFARIGAGGAGNIEVDAGTYRFYLNDITGGMLITPVE